MENFTVMLVQGREFHVFCARCGKDKSSTDVSVVKEIPWKYFCGHCITCLMMDAEKEGKVVMVQDDRGEFSQFML